MRKNNCEKKARSVGAEIIEALHNAVAYAKGDNGKGRTHRMILLLGALHKSKLPSRQSRGGNVPFPHHRTKMPRVL
jgi:hypothetical protein